MCLQNVYFECLYKFASMILWLVDKKALMQFIVCKTEKATSLKNIGRMQDTGLVAYNIFVVVFQGSSGSAEQAGTSTSFVTGE